MTTKREREGEGEHFSNNSVFCYILKKGLEEQREFQDIRIPTKDLVREDRRFILNSPLYFNNSMGLSLCSMHAWVMSLVNLVQHPSIDILNGMSRTHIYIYTLYFVGYFMSKQMDRRLIAKFS